MAVIGAIMFFFGQIWILKTTGETHVANLYPTTPYTWNEIFQDIPKIIVFSVLLEFLLLFYFLKKKSKIVKKLLTLNS